MLKKLLSAILCISMMVSVVACTSEPANVEESSASDTSTEAVSSAEPVVEDPIPAGLEARGKSLTLTFAEIGVSVTVVKQEKGDVVSATLGNDELTLTAAKAGEDVIRLENEYAEGIVLHVYVDAKGELYTSAITPFTAPAFSMNVLENGATADGNADSTAAFQQCIDRASEAGGGTVYVPAGEYRVGTLVMRPHVALRLEGNLPDARVGYTSEVKEWAKNAAIIRGNGSNVHNFFYMNLDPNGYCDEGCSDFLISGGVYDCQGKYRIGAFTCGSNITFENYILLDTSNGHCYQIAGCSDLTIRNVMHAGLRYTGSTSETIQIEMTTKGAITSDYATSPIKYHEGDYFINENVTVSGCYFGKSDNYGAHVTSLGHHSVTGAVSCRGLTYTFNVVEDPIYCGVHLIDVTDVVMTNNKFISTSCAVAEAIDKDSALVSLYCLDKASAYTNENNQKATYRTASEVDGDRNYVIRENEFVIGGNTPLRAVNITGTAYSWGAQYSTVSNRAESASDKPHEYVGYTLVTNLIGNISITENVFRVLSQPAYENCFLQASKVQGFEFENNGIELADGVYFSVAYKDQPGLMCSSCTGITDGSKRTVKLNALGHAYFVGEDGKKVEIPVKDGFGRLTIISEGKGTIELAVDRASGDLLMSAVSAVGYSFAGFTLDGAPYDIGTPVFENLNLVAVFTEK